jgi:hypothetical protein
MKLAVLIAVVVISLPAPALAADWVLVSTAVDGDKYYIDRQSIRTVPNGYKRAWERDNYAEANEFGATSAKLYWEYDCIEKRRRNMSVIIFKDAELITNRNKVDDWSYVSPESVEEGLLHFVCRK